MKVQYPPVHAGASPVRRRSLGRRVLVVLVIVFMPAVLTVSCSQPIGGGGDEGSLSIGLGDVAAASTYGDQGLEPESYLFSGTGPNGETFSVVSSEEKTTVPGLKSGEWEVRVEGLNGNDEVILAGEGTVEVLPFEDAAVELALRPVDGIGAIEVRAAWKADHTLDPSVTITVTGSDGQSETLTAAANSGAAEKRIEELPTGYYRVAVRLYDGEEEVAGSAHTVRIVNGSGVKLNSELDALNKVGKPIEINGEQFTIAWDAPADSEPEVYRVYYRQRGEYHWELIEAIDAQSNPQYTVTKDTLSYGTYELAVSSVSKGEESALHSSMADSAQPESGWYVRWEGP